MVERAFQVFFLSLGLGLIWTTIVFLFGTPADIPDGMRVLVGIVLCANGGINFAIMRNIRHPWYRFLRPLNLIGTVLGLAATIVPAISVLIVRIVLVLYCAASTERALNGAWPRPRR